MGEPAKQFELNSDPTLSNAGVTPQLGGGGSYRNPIPSTSTANMTIGPPALPPRPEMGMQQSYGMNSGYSYGGMGGGGYGMGGMGGMGGYGSYGGFGGYGGGYGMGMGMSPYSGFNRYDPMYSGNMESRFIQMAEENSRPAFDSIQSFVSAVGSVSMMLENTFFALTSSFRAILGVAENFGRLRSLFAQFWSTFAVVRSLNWLVRKLMVLLGIRTEYEFKVGWRSQGVAVRTGDRLLPIAGLWHLVNAFWMVIPPSIGLQTLACTLFGRLQRGQAWAEAVAATQNGTATPEQRARGSSWPILMFFGVVVAAPYLVLKMLNGLSTSINERLNDPTTWQHPLRAVAHHDFQATTPQEISFSANQVLTLAPQHLQGHLWNSGWVMATTDRKIAGLIPVNYIKVIKPVNDAQSNETKTEKQEPQPSVSGLDKYYNNEL